MNKITEGEEFSAFPGEFGVLTRVFSFFAFRRLQERTGTLGKAVKTPCNTHAFVLYSIPSEKVKNPGRHKELMKKINVVKDYLKMTVGSLLMAIGVYFFKIPNGFSMGGVSGISTLLGKLIPSEIFTPGTLIAIFNILLLIIGFLVIGKSTGIRTVYSSLVFSAFTWAFERLIPLSVPLTDQTFLELVYAILTTGIGSAFLFNCQASSGGTDIVALILKKFTSLDVGKALLCTDCLIACGAFFVFDLKTGMYSLLGLFCKAFLIDGIIENINVCKSFMIITNTPEPVVDYIIHQMGHSATTMDACGEYRHRNCKAIVTVCRRLEAVKLRRFLHENVPDAFIIIQSTSEIIGRGFREI